MDARELRPGNNVIYKPTGDIVTVLYAGPKGWAFETTWEWNESAQEELQEIEWLSMEAAEPIPLTPEILEAAELMGDFCQIAGQFETTTHIGKEGRLAYIKQFIKKIEYVHQLQNCYFDLFGSELQIDLIKVKA